MRPTKPEILVRSNSENVGIPRLTYFALALDRFGIPIKRRSTLL